MNKINVKKGAPDPVPDPTAAPATRRLPSMAALRAFEASARLLSFTAAAGELAQTQGAISHQIRDLEARLGVSLFERRARGIRLSEDGHCYLPYVREALDKLRAGERALAPAPADNVLTVSCSPNFAQKWLVPRLGQFLSDNPGIDLRISAVARHVSFDNDGIDVAIRHGDGNWPSMYVNQLCTETVFPVCSPHLQPPLSVVRKITDLNQYNLIHDQQRDNWPQWLRDNGIDPTAFALDRGLRFSQTSLAIDAALAGQGVALARSALVEIDLKAGRLVRPVKEELRADFSYWIVCPAERASDRRIQNFIAWLHQQIDPTTDLQSQRQRKM